MALATMFFKGVMTCARSSIKRVNCVDGTETWSAPYTCEDMRSLGDCGKEAKLFLPITKE